MEQRSTEEETASSDDLEVSMANINRHGDNVVIELDEKSDEKACTDVESENEEVVSNGDYSYSEDSIYSDDFCRGSDMTHVTPRSSLSAGSPLSRTLSLEYPIGRRKEEIAREQSIPRRLRVENGRENLLRTSSSANDNRYSNNSPHSQSLHLQFQRRNMSFTDMEMQKIERENQFLLKKIMAQHKPQNKSMRIVSAQPKISSSAINRKKMQKRIEEENMMLLRRIQEAKPYVVSSNTTPGYRVTSL